jgi:hypothetical protein
MIAVLVMGSFIVFSCSCYSVQPIKPAKLSSPGAGKIKIFKVEKTSGESITFTKKSPGRILDREIVGTGSLTDAVESVEIASADLEKVTPKKGLFQSVKTREGKWYDLVNKIVEQGDKSILCVIKRVRNPVPELFRISISEVERAWAIQHDNELIWGVLAGILIVRVVGMIMFAIDTGGRGFLN